MAIQSRLDPQNRGYSSRLQRKAAEGRGVTGEMHSQPRKGMSKWQVRGLVWVQVLGSIQADLLCRQVGRECYGLIITRE